MRKIYCDKCKKPTEEPCYSIMIINGLIHVGWELPKFIPQYELCRHCYDEVMLILEPHKDEPGFGLGYTIDTERTCN